MDREIQDCMREIMSLEDYRFFEFIRSKLEFIRSKLNKHKTDKWQERVDRMINYGKNEK